jgi:hypothetical protein
MADGWRCPVCGRGVAPTEKVCDHGGLGALQPYQPVTVPVADCGCPPGVCFGATNCPRYPALPVTICSSRRVRGTWSTHGFDGLAGAGG